MEGGYAFIDSSYPRKPGDIALLASEDFEPTGEFKNFFTTRNHDLNNFMI